MKHGKFGKERNGSEFEVVNGKTAEKAAIVVKQLSTVKENLRFYVSTVGMVPLGKTHLLAKTPKNAIFKCTFNFFR